MTPLRRQYLEIKRRFPGVIVLFRLGDFYETFDEDAELCARELNLTLTSRPLGKGERIPMAGIPHHALNGYLARLVGRGHRVAICDQIGEPNGKGLVARDVTRVVTPGTALTDDILESAAANFLAAVAPHGPRIGLAWADVSTGEFATSEIDGGALTAELARIAPAELLLVEEGEPPDGWTGSTTRVRRTRDPERAVLDHFGAVTLEPFGCAQQPAAIEAAAMVVAYLQETQPRAAAFLTRLRAEQPSGFLQIDGRTRRNLGLLSTNGQGGASVASVIDRTRTPMGARLLRRHLSEPLTDVAAIEARLDVVQHFLDRPLIRAAVREALAPVRDLERLLTRAGAGAATPRDLVALRLGLEAVDGVRAANGDEWGPLPALPDVSDPARLIGAAIADDPPAAVAAGGVIREGYHQELDETRGLASDARSVLAALESRERERTGIKSLRVTFNRVFGYAIEVSNANLHLVPEEYQRRQTLAGGERFVTAELKEYESRVVGAQERAAALEESLFRDVCAQVTAHQTAIRALASALAVIDLAAANAEAAATLGYCRPVVDDGDVIDIKEGRHPVVEQALPSGAFVPNDSYLSNDARITILTGPNMAGKSTWLRQTALIVLLAQAGFFVPARSARVGVVDRLFTRVGAQDDLAAGQSTFMVEMVETAHILHNATPRSFVILDEVGRGTSTWDGLAIARAVVEHLHSNRSVAAKTLFATHYHELTALAGTLPHVRNASVAVTEQDGEVVFLRQIIAGGADRSYGIHVARLAGLPQAVTRRAAEILAELETAGAKQDRSRRNGSSTNTLQLSLFTLAASPIVDDLVEMDIDGLSPLEALTRLYELRERARAERAAGPVAG